MFGLISWLREVAGDDRPTLDAVVNAVTAEVGRGVRRGEREASTAGFTVSVERVEVRMPLDASVVSDDANPDAPDGASIRAGTDGNGELTLTVIPDRDGARPPDRREPATDADGRDVSTVADLSPEETEALRSAGISTVPELAGAPTDAVASAVGGSTDRADRLIAEAELLRLGARPRTATALAALGHAASSLARADPSSLLADVDRAVERGERAVEGYEADLAELDDLVSQAEQAVERAEGDAERAVQRAKRTVEGAVEGAETAAAQSVDEAENDVEQAVESVESVADDVVHEAEGGATDREAD